MRVVVAIAGAPHHWYLIHQLRKEFPDILVVVENGKHQRKQRAANHEWAALGYEYYHLFRRSILGLKRYRKRYFQLHQHNVVEAPKIVPCTSINEKHVVSKINEFNADIIVICGISIIKQTTLAQIDPPIINIHGGYLPYYRGNHCFFFAMWENEWTRLGSTIHYVDQGVDTGDIIENIQVNPSSDDIAETLYCRAERIAINRLVTLLVELRRGKKLNRTKSLIKRKLYQTRDRGLLKEIAFWFRWPRRVPWGWFRRIQF